MKNQTNPWEERLSQAPQPEIESIYKIKEVGELIKEARKKAHLTQQELAELTGLKRSFISRIERNGTSVRLSTLIHIVEKGLRGHININISV